MCGKRYRQTLKRIFSAARPELPLLAGAAVALVVSSATSLIFPKAVGIIVDKIGPAAEPGASQEAKEEARQLLEIMEQEEKKVQEKLKKAQKGPNKSKKDW